jgi:energy-converting hydrogenase Eha subunit F
MHFNAIIVFKNGCYLCLSVYVSIAAVIAELLFYSGNDSHCIESVLLVFFLISGNC